MEKHQTLRTERAQWDPVFQELKELVRPDTTDFSGGRTLGGDARRRIFDGTAPWSLDQMASGVHSYNTSPVDRWFNLGVAGTPMDQLDHAAKLALEQRSDIIYAHYANQFAALNPTLHELYLDLGAFGTGAIYQWFDLNTSLLRFRAYPLGDCWIEEDASGHVIRVHRAMKWPIWQVREEFGRLTEQLAKKKDTDKVTIIHAVFPRLDRNPKSRLPVHRAYASCYFCPETEECLAEGGYDWMPYHTPRWTKLSGETYGRAPALSVLPEIRMVNAMRKTLITSAQKLADPPLQVEDDGFLMPLKTAPGSLNYKRPGSANAEPLPTAQRIDVTVDMIEQSRDMIRRGFFVDWLVRPTKKERQTAEEIRDDRNQMLSMMAPVIGRLQSELTGPMIELSHNLLERHGLFNPLPPSLDGAELEISYISPAAKAQSTVRGQGVSSYISQVTQLLPVMPDLADSINSDALNAELQDLTDVPRRVLNDPKTVAAKRQAREQQQQLAQMAQIAPAMGKTAKDLAQAQQAGLPLQ